MLVQTARLRTDVPSSQDKVFLIRERKSAEEEPGPDDRIVRSFVIRHDAYMYADTVNNKQKKLDEHHSHWAQPAI